MRQKNDDLLIDFILGLILLFFISLIAYIIYCITTKWNLGLCSMLVAIVIVLIVMIIIMMCIIIWLINMTLDRIEESKESLEESLKSAIKAIRIPPNNKKR